MKYLNLFLMGLLSFLSMYILMYMMVDIFSNIYLNLNQFYMAGLMVIPMIVAELLLMGSMYTNKSFNKLIIFISTILFMISIILIRQQVAIDDKEFIRSMIPHHAGAILMAKKAKLTNPQLKNLADTIIKDQQREINFMKKILTEIENKS